MIVSHAARLHRAHTLFSAELRDRSRPSFRRLFAHVSSGSRRCLPQAYRRARARRDGTATKTESLVSITKASPPRQSSHIRDN